MSGMRWFATPYRSYRSHIDRDQGQGIENMDRSRQTTRTVEQSTSRLSSKVESIMRHRVRTYRLGYTDQDQGSENTEQKN